MERHNIIIVVKKTIGSERIFCKVPSKYYYKAFYTLILMKLLITMRVKFHTMVAWLKQTSLIQFLLLYIWKEAKERWLRRVEGGYCNKRKIKKLFDILIMVYRVVKWITKRVTSAKVKPVNIFQFAIDNAWVLNIRHNFIMLQWMLHNHSCWI